MSRIPLALLVLLICFCVSAGATDTEKNVSADELVHIVTAAQGMRDADLAQKLAGLVLTERLSATRLADLTTKLPGDKSRQQLMLIADQSIFLPPPADDIPANAAPDASAARDMLLKVANYVNQTVRQLPNLMATRFTNGFEDQPREEWSSQNGFDSTFYKPLHWIGSLKMQVTYRDRHEIQEKSVRAEKKGDGVGGLITAGEFGPVLSTVLADAVKGKIVWTRWEKGTDGTLAVFHYQVPEDKSNYYVKFCCISEGYSAVGGSETQVWNKRAAYHGDIVFSPADGSIRLLTVDADMPAGALVSRAAMAIEYAPTTIGGHNYFCPVRSVSLLRKHTVHQLGASASPNFEGPIKTFMNDIRFNNYRRFGSETKVLTDLPTD